MKNIDDSHSSFIRRLHIYTWKKNIKINNDLYGTAVSQSMGVDNFGELGGLN